ncbi:hypothetical protein D7S86_27970 [Pararobbsia silviterrae]|uniref:Uncharacterized protein n=1 Tax=Pararobbsia silviterrae TaxID=1792498 RepID=A0A494X8A5_9BURK|nr:hypothetical protein D7S86_27970 [Pararobbsia silviterrae]
MSPTSCQTAPPRARMKSFEVVGVSVRQLALKFTCTAETNAQSAHAASHDNFMRDGRTLHASDIDIFWLWLRG